jgi:hypothetical protein
MDSTAVATGGGLSWPLVLLLVIAAGCVLLWYISPRK